MNNHNLYKDPKTGNVLGYDQSQVDAGLVREGLVRLTDAEVAEHLAPPTLTERDVEMARLLAYAHPLTGCDRYKAEADAERLAGNEKGAVEAEEKLLARREEIKNENPWPRG